MKKLTDWIPGLARKVKKPEMMIHLKAQQFAKEQGISWGMEMPNSHIETLSNSILDYYIEKK